MLGRFQLWRSRVVFDTGSPNMWLVSASKPCTSKLTPMPNTTDALGYNCSNAQKYDHTASSSYVADGAAYKARYDAGKLRGMRRDVVVLF